ncbi:MAG: hypothetical protein K2Y39_20230 [Candidatus Obscuribacterales bacterium]|nr:hypothetical protein [Candidatus Obscuribacterales bacterium]
MDLFAFLDPEALPVLGWLALLVIGIFVCAYLRNRPERKAARLQRQRRMLGIEPGVGANQRHRSPIRQSFPKRCPRGVCTKPGASCPQECVEEPLVKRLVDGRVVHEYDNVEVCFGPGSKILELKVDGRMWL